MADVEGTRSKEQDSSKNRMLLHRLRGFCGPLAYLSTEALLELVDVMMIAAHESGCVFDGFQVDLSDLQQRPWWKFW